MFKNKFDFKKDFMRRVVEKYGRSLENSHVTEQYLVLGEMIRQYASINWKTSKERVIQLQAKQMYYFSMEFLIGRLLTSNLMNLGVYDTVNEGLKELGINLSDLEEIEQDPGLGNGGLGRLAACFMDSLATMSYPGHGNTIRYEYGLFKQKIQDGYQVEMPDQWLKLGNIWEIKKPKYSVKVPFWGKIDITTDREGIIHYDHIDPEYVRAVPCDIPIIGNATDMTNTLRLWTSEPCEDIPANKDLRTYLSEIKEITQNVYPDDSTERGRYLRLKQQYFFVSAGVQAIVSNHITNYNTLDNLHEKVVIQLNDTHPVLAIPELMRILMDEHHYKWDQAWSMVSRIFAYTNHTIMEEALEKWPIEYIKKLLPRVFMIIEEINRRHKAKVYMKTNDQNMAQNTACIKDGLVHMANLAIISSYSVNGVAEIHTDILKTNVFRNFFQLYPEKFNSKTNGITHRRWLVYSNPQLTQCLKDTIGDDFIYKPSELEKLMGHVDERGLQERFLEIKAQRKQILIDFIEKETGIKLSPNSLFDTLAKRLHAYKRQLLKCLHIIYLIQRIKSDPDFNMHHQTFIFAAKAAPSYKFAKQVIKLINTLSEIVEADPLIQKYIKVVFIPNYRVSVAEILMNATDLSEQISTAGKEASGTGNMKFMMNGAITIGTLDGANVEIHQLVGNENDIIFGLKVEDVNALMYNGYSARDELKKSPALNKAVTALVDGSLHPNRDEFRIIYDELIYKNDEYFVLADFEAYCKAQEEVQRRYQDRHAWAKSCLINIAKSGYFSSDRTIKNYVEDIWHIDKVL